MASENIFFNMLVGDMPLARAIRIDVFGVVFCINGVAEFGGEAGIWLCCCCIANPWQAESSARESKVYFMVVLSTENNKPLTLYHLVQLRSNKMTRIGSSANQNIAIPAGFRVA